MMTVSNSAALALSGANRFALELPCKPGLSGDLRRRVEYNAHCHAVSMRPQSRVFHCHHEGLVVPPVPETRHPKPVTLCMYYCYFVIRPRSSLVFSRLVCGESGESLWRSCQAEEAVFGQRFRRLRLQAICAVSRESTESLPWPSTLTKGMQAEHSARYADFGGVSSATRRTLPCGSALSTSSR